MPAGLYYTKDAYVKRWGDEEFTRLTADDDGVADPLAFDTANADASADMDMYLSGRYKLPFAEPYPRSLVSIAAVLVREKLHGTFPTETVTDEANRARKMLGDLSTGKAQLTIDETGEAPEAGSGTGGTGVLWSAPARVFTAEKLDRF